MIFELEALWLWLGLEMLCVWLPLPPELLVNNHVVVLLLSEV